MATSRIAKGEQILDLRKTRIMPTTQAQWRQKIQVSKILNFLQDHVVNGTEAAPTRITAGLALLRKVLPDALPDIVLPSNQQVMPEQLKVTASQLLESITVSYTVSQVRDQETVPAIEHESAPNTLPVDSYTLAEDASVIVGEGEGVGE